MVFQSEIIGQSIQRIDGPDKVTGETLYTADVVLPGMLTGKILRSPHPHARIGGFDTTAAWAVPGVKAIVTGEDARGFYQGKVLRHLPVLCWDKVRVIGDRVAAVAAVTASASVSSTICVSTVPCPANAVLASAAAWASTSHRHTLAPDCSSRCEMAKPIPRAPPVMTAFRPERSIWFMAVEDNGERR